jgi:hypothetical protein
MKEIIAKIKNELSKEAYSQETVVSQLKELREYFKSNLNEPGLVKMIRLAYEEIENKYNREELREIRDLMEGIERPEEEEEE